MSEPLSESLSEPQRLCSLLAVPPDDVAPSDSLWPLVLAESSRRRKACRRDSRSWGGRWLYPPPAAPFRPLTSSSSVSVSRYSGSDFWRDVANWRIRSERASAAFRDMFWAYASMYSLSRSLVESLPRLGGSETADGGSASFGGSAV